VPQTYNLYANPVLFRVSRVPVAGFETHHHNPDPVRSSPVRFPVEFRRNAGTLFDLSRAAEDFSYPVTCLQLCRFKGLRRYFFEREMAQKAKIK
jgi:hypothetical protein